MFSSKRKSDILLFALLSLLIPSVAHAYLDPGTGSYVLQILLAGIVAAVFAVKVFWLRLTSFFGNRFGRRGDSKSDHE